MPLGVHANDSDDKKRDCLPMRFVELAFAAENKTRFYSRRWYGRSRTVKNTSVERANGEKDHGIVEGDERGAPASDFEGKIDARKKKKKHTQSGK